MNPKHRHVEKNWHSYEAKRPSHEVLDPQHRRNTEVTEQRPKLEDSRAADGSDCEEAHPLAANHSTETEASKCKP